jgi:hypothetical protein
MDPQMPSWSIKAGVGAIKCFILQAKQLSRAFVLTRAKSKILAISTNA